MTSLKEQGITINILPDPGETCIIVGDQEGYDDIRPALDLAMQSKRTHPEEGYKINQKGDRWYVVRLMQ
jgi:hypothetical protein